MVAMGIPFSAFVQHQATAYTIFTLRTWSSWPNASLFCFHVSFLFYRRLHEPSGIFTTTLKRCSFVSETASCPTSRKTLLRLILRALSLRINRSSPKVHGAATDFSSERRHYIPNIAPWFLGYSRRPSGLCLKRFLEGKYCDEHIVSFKEETFAQKIGILPTCFSNFYRKLR